MNSHFGSNHSNRICVLEIIFPIATPYVLVKDASLMNELSQTVGVRQTGCFLTNMKIIMLGEVLLIFMLQSVTKSNERTVALFYRIISGPIITKWYDRAWQAEMWHTRVKFRLK